MSRPGNCPSSPQSPLGAFEHRVALYHKAKPDHMTGTVKELRDGKLATVREGAYIIRDMRALYWVKSQGKGKKKTRDYVPVKHVVGSIYRVK